MNCRLPRRKFGPPRPGLPEVEQFIRKQYPATGRKESAAEIQERAATLGTHYPLGEWYGMMVHRTNTKGWMPPMTAMLFWNAEKTGP